MKWRCVIIQRWLPGYPAGDLKPFWLRRVKAHLQVCPDCRQELEELQAAVALLTRHSLPEPGPEFWEEFQRELHLKLAQANQVEAAPAPAPRRLRLPYYLLGAPAVAVLVLWAAGYLGHLTPGREAQLATAPRPADQRMTEAAPALAKKEKAAPAPLPAQPQEGELELAAHGKPGALHKGVHEPGLYKGYEEGTWEEEDFPSWDLDSALAGLSPEERAALAEKLSTRRK